MLMLKQFTVHLYVLMIPILTLMFMAQVNLAVAAYQAVQLFLEHSVQITQHLLIN